MASAPSDLRQIPVDKIDRNPDNPRLIFRASDLAELQESIRLYGVQVPIAVYKEGSRYVLIDGERRWRCALKLAQPTIPALVQPRPSALDNILLMFNIHSLREQWDLLTIAMKLPRIVQLLRKELGTEPTERQLSEKTGLKRAVIRRCKLLIALPAHYRDEMLAELEKPKPAQKLTEDLFIELERALTTVERAMPEVIQNRDAVRRVLLHKFKTDVISNRVLFRQVARIARADRVGGDRKTAANELSKLFANNKYTIEDAYEKSVGGAYAERDLGTRVRGLLSALDNIDADELDEAIVEELEALQKRIADILRGES
jgi:ParB/RepB/Spo0J family partition protein